MSEEANIFVPAEHGYVVLDTESQGYARFCPIEIALARFSPNGALLDSYSTLVRPRVARVSRVVTELTGITTEMIRTAPSPREVMGTVRDFLGDSVIVGHDVNANDISIIDHFCEAYYGRKLPCPHVDTLYWAQTLFPDLEHYNLKALAEFFHAEADSYHRALDDCLTTSRVYQCLLAAARELSPRRREAVLRAFAHRHDEKEKKTEAARDRPPRVRRPLDYGHLPVYHETKKTAAFAHLAVLSIARLTPEGARKIELFVRGDAPQTELFFRAHPECGWTRDEDGLYAADSLSVACLDKLGRVLRADGCRLYRAESGEARAAFPTSPYARGLAEPPVEIELNGDGYEIVFIDASRGIPEDWLGAQPGVQRLSFFRFRVSAQSGPAIAEMRKKLARLGWPSAVRDPAEWDDDARI